MEFRPIERASGVLHESVSPDQIVAMCRRAFGAGTDVVSAAELGGGLYEGLYGLSEDTYRVEIGADRPVILRVAPEPGRQARTERELMRNELASGPYLAPIASMLPRTLAADWTHEIIGRDYLWQAMLDGVPAPDGLAACPGPQRAALYRQLGTIAGSLHRVRGDRFGRVAGPTYASWSEAVTASLEDTAADLEDAGLDATDLRKVITAVYRHRSVLDEIDEPRLLHGGLWIPNIMIVPGVGEPAVTGVLGHGLASWGDPAADRTIFEVGRHAGTDADAFWETYDASPDFPVDAPGAAWRALIYRAWHVGATRLERHRLGRYAKIAGSYDEMREVLGLLVS